MGIRDLWGTLSPYCQQKSMYTIEGQTLAIDLAGWVVSGQNVGGIQPNITQGHHFGIVFSRTVQLLELNTSPVFVLEGKAPKIKYDTIAKRILLLNQNKEGNQNKDVNQEIVKGGKDRTRFQHYLKQFADMLKYMGLTCITGQGEAEAMCAYLNSKNMVDAVVSSDSDCFAYGAHTVYRKLSKTTNLYEHYCLKKAQNQLDLTRNKIVAFALFCGSDYDAGVPGVGKDNVLEFLKHIPDGEVLDRIRSWRTKPEYFEQLQKKVKNLFDTSIDEVTRKRLKLELQIRQKALQNENFPNEEILQEYLVDKDFIEELDLTWYQPNLVAMMRYAVRYMRWSELLTFQRFLPLMTLWQLKNHKLVAEKIASNKVSDLKGVLFPNKIVKKKVIKGVPCYEIEWEDKLDCYIKLIPQEQINEAKKNILITIEKATLVDEAYPKLIEEFGGPVKKKKLERRRCPKNPPTSKTKKLVDEASNSALPKIDAFFPKTKVARLKNEAKQHDYSFDLNCSGFSDDDDGNMSLIIDEIVSKPSKILEKVEKFGIKCTPEIDYNDVILESNLEFMREQNNFNVSSSFFAPICDKSLSGDDTINYDPDELEILNEVNAENGENKCQEQDNLDDTFDLDKPYIPLFERIKKNY